MKPQFDINENTPDQWRAILASGEQNIPKSWYDKNELEKRAWLLKKIKQEQRFTQVDIHAEKVDKLRTRMGAKLVKKRRLEDEKKYGF